MAPRLRGGDGRGVFAGLVSEAPLLYPAPPAGWASPHTQNRSWTRPATPVSPAKAGAHSALPAHSLSKIKIQIPPSRIRLRNHIQLPRAVPLLDLFLTGNSLINLLVTLEPHQSMDPVLPGKPLHQIFPMLPHPTQQFRRHPHVKRPVPPTGENINITFSLHLDVALPPKIVLVPVDNSARRR